MATKEKTEVAENITPQTEEVVEPATPEVNEEAPKKSTAKKPAAKKASTTKKATTTKKAASTKATKKTTKKSESADEPAEKKTEPKKKAEKIDEFDAETTPIEKPKTTSKVTAKPVPIDERGVIERRKLQEHVLTIGDTLSVVTDEEIYTENAIDIRESMQNNKILTGVIESMEQVGSKNVATVRHGDIKVIIPIEDAVDLPAHRSGDISDEEALQWMLTKRLGAEIDYVVVRVDEEHKVAVGNRLKAMAIRRRQIYFRTDREGNNLIYPDKLAEARVVAVVRTGIFVEIFGAECFIPNKELSYQRIANVTDNYQVGQIILVRILEIVRNEDFTVKVSASVKAVKENPTVKVFNTLRIGQKHIGTVTQVDPVDGIFINLGCGIDCKCDFPKRGRPVRGSKVTVQLTWLDGKQHRVFGAIIGMSAVL